MDVVIAGGGVAGLEALLGLRAVAGDRVRLTLIAPDPDFSYRPLAVAEPFALGHAHKVPLTRFTQDADAELVIESLESVDDAAGEVALSDRSRRSFDALLVATGGRAVSGVDGATTWWPGGDADTYGGLLQDIEQGYAKSIAIVVPPGAVWPLPAYELALMTVGEAREMGQDVKVAIVTPERAPLALFGPEASSAVGEELRWAGIDLELGVVVQNASELDYQRVFAVPRIVGPIVEGLPMDEEGFIEAGDDGLVAGCERTWAAGDGIVSPVKFGGMATHQARVAVAGIARLAGVEDVPDPGEAVLHGRLLIGRRTRRLRGRGDAEGAPLWWPHGKVSGEYLPRWLAEHGVEPAPASEKPPDDEGVTIRQPLHAMRAPEFQYLHQLGREYRSGDPAIAALGRRMREARGR